MRAVAAQENPMAALNSGGSAKITGHVTRSLYDPKTSIAEVVVG
jgi:hypothetical protein